ncbi:hypothetical protein TPHA_0N01370 [Tetrapisispora phaffii CBS 4417]|uniref:Uncharacterized protein n=1 Tax=Tetrapisispora phaffii (strain ATCC 24235 / CBS 4417 / NBRC 1672 / NRRL Y-8282 / UCD 70-5) TaxID=1071381 RepID=G8C190_TETPH|nr:hypothetical protein TPHA_0N01370 [Tetrapisispora phaffii CBS 4417]CCE65918.1 hypothetical protein TPHA_0N01370 [Tetrapisispora phaffii CBS 4417]
MRLIYTILCSLLPLCFLAFALPMENTLINNAIGVKNLYKTLDAVWKDNFFVNLFRMVSAGETFVEIPELNDYEMYTWWAKYNNEVNQTVMEQENSVVGNKWYIEGINFMDYKASDHKSLLKNLNRKFKSLLGYMPGFFVLSVTNTNVYEGYEEYFHL